MSKGYLQALISNPDAKGGTLRVRVAGHTVDCPIYDPLTEEPILQPLHLDIQGVAPRFIVDQGFVYDMYFFTNLGAPAGNIWAVSAGGQGDVGPTGPRGPQGVTGATGAKGATGSAGTDGEKGDKGDTGASGANGVSLVSIRVDETSNTGRILYNKSDNINNWIYAGDIMPAGIGQIAPQVGAPLTYLNDAMTSDTNFVLNKTNSGVEITSPKFADIDAAIDAIELDIVDIKADIVDLESRVTALETESIHKAVIFAGNTGDTTVAIAHGMGTSNISVTCFDTLTNSIIFLNVVVTDTHITISDLAPLTTTNQIKVLVMR